MQAWNGRKWGMARRIGSAAVVVVLGVAMLLSACAKCNGNSDPSTMGPMSTVMLRLAKQAQGLVLTGKADPAQPEALPPMVLAGDDEAREMFADYQLRAATLRDKDGNARPVMLLCTGDGGHALIERMDCLNSVRKGQHWQSKPLPPCEFTFRDPAVVCAPN